MFVEGMELLVLDWGKVETNQNDRKGYGQLPWMSTMKSNPSTVNIGSRRPVVPHSLPGNVKDSYSQSLILHISTT